MATSFSRKMQELRRVVRLHANWLVYATLGESALAKSEVEELEKYGKLPMGKALDLAEKSYLLGRLRATLRRSEFKDVSFEEVAEKAEDMKLSPLEQLVIEQAKLRAGQALKRLANTVSDRTVDTIQQTMAGTISDASVRDTVAAETVLALIYKKSAQQLASDLASKLQGATKRNWSAVARTELHAAKVQGAAQAIVNKVDIYAHSDGADSDVSIVPASVCCDDCKHHYLDASGNPKIFKLSRLLNAGSNGDGDVSHAREGKRHVHWKTTLPPMHPNCGCQVQYIPPGYGWDSGKLVLLNKSLFETNLIKATSGVSGGIKPTVAPTGPDGDTATSKKTPNIPSLPGAAAPGNVAGPGRPSGGLPKPGSGTPGGAGGGPDLAPCPFGGGAECTSNGGNGATMHKPNGSIMKKHQEAMARGAAPVTEEAKDQQKKQQEADAQKFNAQPHPHDVVLAHLSEGEIGVAERKGGTVNAPYKVTIVGNGSGAMKKEFNYEDLKKRIKDAGMPESHFDNNPADFVGSVPHGTDQYREVGAYKLARGLGMDDHVPPTVLRYGTGEKDTPTGLTSVQQWHEDYKQADEALAANGFDGETNSIGAALTMATKQGKHLELATKLCEIGVMDMIMNNNDRHSNNLIFSSDMTDVKAIDHGAAFGVGMQGHKNSVAKSMSVAGRFGMPDHMKQKLDSMSLGDFKRSLEGSHLEDWTVAQTFLRARYASHLQDAHGHIPFDNLKGVWGSPNGKVVMPRPRMGYGSPVDFFKDHDAGKLPEQQFDSFAKTYLTKASKDPNHPDHEAAKELLEMKPLMGRGCAPDPAKYRAEGKHEAHWDKTPANYDLDFKAPDREQHSTKLRSQFVGRGKVAEQAAPVRKVPEMPKEEKGTAPTNAGKIMPKEEKGTAVTNLGDKKPKSDSGKTPSQSGVRKKPDPERTISESEKTELDVEGKTFVSKSLYIADLNKPFPT